eukprot:364487-Chlamydomonas_euryale.AAC.13
MHTVKGCNVKSQHREYAWSREGCTKGCDVHSQGKACTSPREVMSTIRREHVSVYKGLHINFWPDCGYHILAGHQAGAAPGIVGLLPDGDCDRLCNTTSAGVLVCQRSHIPMQGSTD